MMLALLRNNTQSLDNIREDNAMQVAEYMQTSLITVPPEALVSVAQHQMRLHRVRHLPVVNTAQDCIGILTDRDIRQAAVSDTAMGEYDLDYLLEKMTVQDIMTRQVITVRTDTSMAEAGRLFIDTKVGCLPVLDDARKLVGLLTVSDVLQAYVQHHDTTTTAP
jgi:acetoin utilization protein AcuB